MERTLHSGAGGGSTNEPAHESEAGSGESSDPGKEPEDSGDCHEDDTASACDLSMGKDEVDVESEHDMLAEVDTDHDGKCDAEDDHDDRQACTGATASGGADDCQSNEDDEQEMDDDHQNSCGASTSGGGTGSMTPPAAQPGVNVI